MKYYLKPEDIKFEIEKDFYDNVVYSFNIKATHVPTGSKCRYSGSSLQQVAKTVIELLEEEVYLYKVQMNQYNKGSVMKENRG